MKLSVLTLSAAIALGGIGQAAPAFSKGFTDNVIRIGFITDMGGVYSDDDGKAGADVIRRAIADAGGQIDGKKIELFVADHQNKADVAASVARRWFDEKHLDMLVGGTNSATALAMAGIAAQKEKPFLVVGSGSPALTNEHCTPYTIQYAYNTVALARGTGSAVLDHGGKTWFFLTADYAFGHSLEHDTAAVVKKAGGTVKGNVMVPLGTADFSSFMLQAQSSGAQVLGLANAGGDFINSIKAANQFGITRIMKVVGLLVTTNDIHVPGLKVTQGLYLTSPWYWNQDATSRAWAKPFLAKFHRAPTFLQAADYSAVAFYLRGVKATGTDDGPALMKWMKSHKTGDFFAPNGRVRADGLMVHDMHLMQVKTPAESKAPWDYEKRVETLAGDKIYGPLSESTCKFIKK